MRAHQPARWRALQLQRDVRASAAAGFMAAARAQALGLRPDCPGLQQGVPLCQPCIVHTANTYNLRVYHLAHCGKYYIKTPASATPFGNEPLLTKLPGSKVNQYACAAQVGRERPHDGQRLRVADGDAVRRRGIAARRVAVAPSVFLNVLGGFSVPILFALSRHITIHARKQRQRD